MPKICHHDLTRRSLFPKSSFDFVKRLTPRLDHVEEANDCRHSCATAKQEVGTGRTLR